MAARLITHTRSVFQHKPQWNCSFSSFCSLASPLVSSLILYLMWFMFHWRYCHSFSGFPLNTLRKSNNFSRTADRAPNQNTTEDCWGRLIRSSIQTDCRCVSSIDFCIDYRKYLCWQVPNKYSLLRIYFKFWFQFLKRSLISRIN